MARTESPTLREKDAGEFFNQRREVGAEAFRKGIRQMVFGD